MIIVTGAAGFIASYYTGWLNKIGRKDLVLVDDFSQETKKRNWEGKQYMRLVDRSELEQFLKDNPHPEFIVHLGARTDTAEMDKGILSALNLNFSKMVWDHCTSFNVPLIYASSAATYGGGELGFDDDHGIISDLKPLNPYGWSKNEFDKWVLTQEQAPPFWAGLKFFNVYGPNEYHKGRMASVIFHAFNQISKTGGMKLFRSHNPDFANGEQLRDFIYVMDVVNVIDFLRSETPGSGIYNLGTGQARTFLDLTRAVFRALDMEENISFIDTPEDIRDNYQYFTEANMTKLKSVGYNRPFTELEAGVTEYVQKFLADNITF